MTQVSINSALGLGLETAKGPLLVTDENGRVIGQFIPQTTPLLNPEDGCPLSDQELRARMAKAIRCPTEGKPLADFWADMDRRP